MKNLLPLAFLLALSACAGSNRYVCFPTSACRRAEAAWRQVGHQDCMVEESKTRTFLDAWMKK